jgi:uncharacterized membrane protein YqjE
MNTPRDGRSDIADRLRDMADDLVELVGAQLRLTRLELQGDARAVGARLARLAALAPLVLVGYACVAGALVVVLARPFGLAGSLLIVGVAQLAVGIGACLGAARALRRVRFLDRSREELRSTVAAVGAPTPRAPR